jgi:hypothetical protein
MEVIGYLGNFGGPNDPLTIRFSRIPRERPGLPRFSNTQYASKEEVKNEDLYNMTLIRIEDLYPQAISRRFGALKRTK